MKILLTGNIFHNYDYSIKEALEALGHNVHLCFNNIEGPFYYDQNMIKWIKFGFLPCHLKIEYFKNKSIERYNDQLEQMISEQNFDLLLVIKGLSIDNRILDHFEGYKVLWMLDSIKRFEKIHQSIYYYDKIYSYEPSDIIYCKEKFNVNIEYLPVGFDDKKYYRLRTVNRTSDFSFVGSIGPNREQIIQKLMENNINIKLIGDFHRSSDKEVRNSCLSKTADHHEINALYNSSHINLNIHNLQSEIGCNPRFYEILGSGGGIQFVEPKESALAFFKDQEEVVYYNSVEEIISKSKFFLKKPELCDKISLTAYNKVRDNHTWKHRVEKILSYR